MHLELSHCRYHGQLSSRDDHYPVYRLNIRQDSEFAIGYPKTAFKREPDMDKDTRNHRRTGRHFTGGAEKFCPENNNLP